MFKKIPIYNPKEGNERDIWINPALLVYAYIDTVATVDVVVFYMGVESFLFKGTPAQLNALLT